MEAPSDYFVIGFVIGGFVFGPLSWGVGYCMARLSCFDRWYFPRWQQGFEDAEKVWKDFETLREAKANQ